MEIKLASGNGSLVAPTRVIIPEGNSHASIELSSASVPSRIQTNIVVTLNEVTSNALLWLLPPGDSAPLMLSVANAASFLSDGISPGAIITLFGLNLGPKTPAGSLIDGSTISTSVAGTRVLVDGTPASIIYIQSDQITAVTPNGKFGPQNVFLQIEANGQRSNPLTLAVTATTPGVFTTNATGIGQGLIINQDGSLNSPTRPAERGSRVFIYASGLGETDSQTKPLAALWIRLGNAAPQLQVTSSKTDFPGLLQLAFQIPQQSETGDAVPIELIAGDQRSQPGVTIAII